MILAVIHSKRMLEISKLAVRLTIIAKRGSARVDRFTQNLLDNRHQTGDAVFSNSVCFPFRGNASPKQRFAYIDVAKPRDDPLIKERRFNWRVSVPELVDKVAFIEQVAQWLGANLLKQPMIVHILCWGKIHRAKASCIIERDAMTIAQVQHHMVMLLQMRRRVVKAAKAFPGN